MVCKQRRCHKLIFPKKHVVAVTDGNNICDAQSCSTKDGASNTPLYHLDTSPTGRCFNQ